LTREAASGAKSKTGQAAPVWRFAPADTGPLSLIAPPTLVPTAPGITSVATPHDAKHPEVDQALELIKLNKLDRGLALLREASYKYPELPSEFVMLYGILDKAGEAKAARNSLEFAIEKTPVDPEPWLICGAIALREGRLGEAEVDIDRASRLLASDSNEPRRKIIEPLILNALAAVSERRERWAEAEVRLGQYLKKSPDDAIAMQRVARAQFWQLRPRDSYDSLKRAKELDVETSKKTHTSEQMLPAAAVIAQYYDAYECAVCAEKSRSAENFFKYSLKVSPNDMNLRTVVARWAIENGEFALAQEQTERLLRAETKDAAQQDRYRAISSTLTAESALWQKKWPDAEKCFEKLLSDQPENSIARRNLALALAEQDDPKKKARAQELAAANAHRSKGDVDDLAACLWVYYRTGEFAKANQFLKALHEATGGTLTNPDTATYVALIIYNSESKAAARRLLRDILQNGRPFAMRSEADKLYENVKTERLEGPPAA
jgi:predicted Zn-dependent protease